ncbi:mannose-6-phosphate isomerase-like protein [Ophiostoma piceae UAMH 11346]|uniref:Mannose-6-phosphate isomerase-like protein n=1 Tax=Ophiostoma piceae (strain UAMH 11346) TaxID=1262450 RepID=S3CVJ1_OPHP1|nr:mannose-6-phosphate isomerase-like protein [Ophiostoma piceae UAMH 11346]
MAAQRVASYVLFLAALAPSLGPVVEAAHTRPIEPTIDGSCPLQLLNPFQRNVYNQCPPPLLDVSRTRPYRSPPRYPWTHPVRCLKTKTNSTPTPGQTHGRERTYCLYSDATFGQLNGVSIVTSPEIAVDLVGADALESRPYYGGSRTRQFTPGPLSQAYTIKPSPGKGLGVMAARKIEQGEIIMLDLPAVLLSKAFLEDAPPLLRRRIIRRGLSQLPGAAQEKVYALDKTTGGDELDAILGTNTISLSLGMNELHLGLYPELSRINHACNPNAYYRFSPRTLAIEVVAYRNIQPNEEITISYAQLTQSRTHRRDFLQSNWHFNCSCSLCRADPDSTTLSEDRRRDMRKLQGTLVEASRGGDYHLALLTAETLHETTDAEGVTPISAEKYDIVASIHLDMREFSQAKKYGTLALEEWEKLDSIDDSQLTAARWFLAVVEKARASDAANRITRAQEDEEKQRQTLHSDTI